MDTGNTKKKEIDLRPAAIEQNKAAGEASTAQVATAVPKADAPVAKTFATTTAKAVPAVVQGEGTDQISVSPVAEPLIAGQSGTEHGASEAAKTSASELATKPSSAKKDDQKKGPLGFFSAEKKPIDVVSDNMEGLEKGKVIVFKGNVVAIQGDLQMFSDTLTAYLGEETNEIEKALANGHVKIVKQDRIATCEEALFENTKGEITLKGNVVVFSGPNKVAGDIVKYFINEDRVSVESEKGKRAHVTVHPSTVTTRRSYLSTPHRGNLERGFAVNPQHRTKPLAGSFLGGSDQTTFLSRFSTAVLATAPTIRSTTWPSLKSNNVGMPRIPNWAGVKAFSSTFIFMTLTLPSYSSAIVSTTGPMVWHGPHQVAQKSTSTGTDALLDFIVKIRVC